MVLLQVLYRSSSGNFGEFVVKINLILKYLYKPKVEFIIFGDLNLYPTNAPDPFKSASYERTKWVRCGHFNAPHSHVQA